jgi:hypothetical protein
MVALPVEGSHGRLESLPHTAKIDFPMEYENPGNISGTPTTQDYAKAAIA